MKKFSTLFVVIAMVSIAAMAVASDNKGPAEIKLPASMGEISFNHEAHQGRIADCKTCHHQGEGTACSSCHGTKPDAPDAKKVFHSLCKDCHKKQNGPTKCKECHTGPKG